MEGVGCSRLANRLQAIYQAGNSTLEPATQALPDGESREAFDSRGSNRSASVHGTAPESRAPLDVGFDVRSMEQGVGRLGIEPAATTVDRASPIVAPQQGFVAGQLARTVGRKGEGGLGGALRVGPDDRGQPANLHAIPADGRVQLQPSDRACGCRVAGPCATDLAPTRGCRPASRLAGPQGQTAVSGSAASHAMLARDCSCSRTRRHVREPTRARTRCPGPASARSAGSSFPRSNRPQRESTNPMSRLNAGTDCLANAAGILPNGVVIV